MAVALLTLSVASASFSTAAVNSMPIDVAPPHIVSSLVSLQNFGGNVGGSFAPLVTGMLVSASNDFAVPLLVAAAVALVFGCGSYGLIVGNLDRELGARTVASAPSKLKVGARDERVIPRRATTIRIARYTALGEIEREFALMSAA